MKVLWACEPFHQENKQIGGFFRLMSQMSGSQDSVEACFVVTRTESDLSLAFDIPAKDRFSVYPLQQLVKLFKKARAAIPENRIHVIDYPTSSNTKAVDRFLGFADEKKADLIALFTHAQKGYKRLLLGSFAETMIHRSKKNILLVNPMTKFTPRIRCVLLASDFSEESKIHVTTSLNLCKRLRAKLVVLHAAQMRYNKAYDDSSQELARYRNEVDKYRDWILAQSSRSGVKIEVEVTSEFNLASETALKIATKKAADLIVVAAKSGPAAALMGGSTTRQIVRASKLPVLVLR